MGEKGPALFRPSVQGPGAPPTLGLQYLVAGAPRCTERAALSCTCGCPASGLAARAEVAGAELPPRLYLVSLPVQSLALGWGSAPSARLRL